MSILTTIPEGYVAYGNGLWARPDLLEHDPSRRVGECDLGKVHPSSPAPSTILLLDCRDPRDIIAFDYLVGGDENDRAVADAVWLRNVNMLIDDSCSALRCWCRRLTSLSMRGCRVRKALSIYKNLRKSAGDKYKYKVTKDEAVTKCF